MPVIRTRVFESSTVLEDVLRRELSRELQTQPSDEQPLLQPLIFQNENSQDGGLNVWVVWEKWRLLPASQRAKIIYEAYETAEPAKAPKIVTVNPVTTQEAIDLGLLPWRVECIELDRGDGPGLRELMRNEGAVDIDAGLVLRFPDKHSAEAARERLSRLSKRPRAWSVEEDKPQIDG
ncbi:MAG: hypothetical protein CHACPFDD_03019 [Phycisphaerae bacterium]|nr:hypothetical protein [Phycisphaerae bacterium]